MKTNPVQSKQLAAEPIGIEDLIGPNVRLVDPAAVPITLPDDVTAVVQGKLRPGAISRWGIEVHDTRAPLSAEGTELLMGWFNEDFRNHTKLNRQEVEDRLGKQQEGGVLYHATNALTYALARTVGWMQPEGLCTIMQDHLKRKDFYDNDLAFFMTPDRAACLRYLRTEGGFYGHGKELMTALGIDLKDERINKLMHTSLLLEIDPRVFDVQLPHAEFPFVIRTQDAESRRPMTEVIAPLMPSDQGEFGVKVLLAVEFSRGGKI